MYVRKENIVMNKYLFSQKNIRLLTYFSLIVLGGWGGY